MDNQRQFLKKRPWMIVAVLVSWVFCLWWFTPRLIALVGIADSLAHKLELVAMIFCLGVFWLFGAYYFWLAFFSVLLKLKPQPAPKGSMPAPKVAVLYVTVNDFEERAAKSCVSQDYPDYHMFIVDDSSEQSKIDEVDAFSARFPGRVSVVRRGTRKGFKAGGLNYCLRNHAKDYPLFAVIDSDGVLPPDFLERMVPSFGASDKIAYVQCSHEPHPIQKSVFASDMSLGILPLWSVWYPPRNNYGFLMFLGHGAVLRRDVWEEVDGFPEVTAEDLAFSSKVRELGYVGLYREDVRCLEDFPETYPLLRRQQEKYVRGGCEYLCKGFKSFVKSKEPKWYEKLDLSISLGSLFLPPFYLLFTLTFFLVLTNYTDQVRMLDVSLFGMEVGRVPWYCYAEDLNSVWTWDYFLLMMLNTFAPVAGCVTLLVRHPIKMIRLLLLSAVPYLSVTVLLFVSTIGYLFTRRAMFVSTGDRSDPMDAVGDAPDRKSSMWKALTLPAESRLVEAAGLVVGMCLMVISIAVFNVTFAAVGVALVLGFIIARIGWEPKWLRPFLYVPFIAIVFGIAILGTNLLGAQGLFVFPFSFHF